MLSFTSRRPAPVGASRLSLSRRNTLGWYGGWYNDPAYADLAAIADFNRDRYAIPTTPLGSISGATAADLCVKRECTFAEWFAFTASSTTARSYTDAAGILRNDLAVDQPRFDWLNGKRQLALNGQSTNLAVNSSAAGPFFGGTLQNNVMLAPDGTLTADRFTEDTSNGEHYAFDRGVPTTGSLDYCVSIFVKFDGNRLFRLRKAVGDEYGVIVNPATLAISPAFNGYKAAGLIPYPNSWYRLWFVYAGNVNQTTVFRAQYTAGNYTGDGLSGHYLWGLNVTQSSFLLPYIPTSASAVTMAIESPRMSPVIEAILQRSAVSVVVRGQNMLRNGGRIVGSNANPMLRGRVDGQGGLVIETVGGSLITAVGGLPLSNSSWGGGVSWNGLGRSLVKDGIALASDNVAMPALPQIWLSRDGGAATNADGHYDFVAVAPSRLSDARLTALAVAA